MKVGNINGCDTKRLLLIILYNICAIKHWDLGWIFAFYIHLQCCTLVWSSTSPVGKLNIMARPCCIKGVVLFQTDICFWSHFSAAFLCLNTECKSVGRWRTCLETSIWNKVGQTMLSCCWRETNLIYCGWNIW